jgi:two-component system sensor histidine kinase AlgZ
VAAQGEPALAEARLLALTARIRPHFLFNSLNGVLGVLRANPRRAEEALEELADLFRALMQDNRELVPLADEIALCERYLSLERLRLGERLQVAWQSRCGGGCGAGAAASCSSRWSRTPSIHGIEPGVGPGTGVDYHRAARAGGASSKSPTRCSMPSSQHAGQPHGPRQYP